MFNMIYIEIWLQLSRLEAVGVYQDEFGNTRWRCGGYWVRVRGARGHQNIGDAGGAYRDGQGLWRLGWAVLRRLGRYR